ncbi:MAG: site-specific DNA-methyltransferase [Sedimentisphaerales bacterium]
MAKHTAKPVRPPTTAFEGRQAQGRMDGNSLSPQKELLELLKSQFPQIFAEGKVNPDKLKQALGEDLDTNNERYGLSWAGKTECFRHIQEMTTATLKPLRSESVDFDKTENIFIEGDNLEVLKVLQRSYYGKIKMIYIDPPYNTGNDSFIYPDRFKEEKDDYELRAGIKDAEGLLTKDGFWRKNSKDAGHFHSNWLSMMYPRLFLAKNLLRNDGVIFVSIDDNEVHNLRMAMNEIFGEENFVGQITILSNPRGRQSENFIATVHEYIIVYAKYIEECSIVGLDLTEEETGDYDKVDENGKHYRLLGLRQRGVAWRRQDRPQMYFPLYVNPRNGSVRLSPDKSHTIEVFPKRPDGQEGRWKWGKGKISNELHKLEGKLVSGRDEWDISVHDYLETEDGIERTKKVKSLWDDKALNYQNGTEEVKLLFNGKTIFSYPKPTSLLKSVVSILQDKSSVALDFFAGSCTTAHAVMALNTEDGGNRKFICVQLAEPCEEESEAFKAGFKTIADIGKERIRRAAKKIKKEIEGNLKFDKNKLDLGFKVLKLEQSNFKQWRENVKTGEELKEQMKMFVDNTTKGAKPDDMLFEIILKNSRFDLNVKVEKQSFDGVDYYRLADGVEIVCLAPKITKKLVDKVLCAACPTAAQKPEKFTCLDIAFKDNDQLKTNTALQMEAGKIEFKVI